MSFKIALARRLSKLAGFGLFAGCLVAFLIAGLITGVQWDRKAPTIQNVSISRTVHAGDNLSIHEHITVPSGCIPRVIRMLSTKRDIMAPDNDIQLLTDSPVVANGNVSVPVPRDTVAKDWYYMEEISTSGCGPFSGIIAPDTVEVRAADGKPGVALRVLGWSLIPTH